MNITQGAKLKLGKHADSVTLDSAIRKLLIAELEALLTESVNFLAMTFNGVKVALERLIDYLRAKNPNFSPKKYGFANFAKMAKTFGLLEDQISVRGKWFLK